MVGLAIGFVVSCALFNGFGQLVTKYSSSVNRSLAEQTRTLVIWVFFLIWQGYGHEEFRPLQLIGFLLVVLGVVFFNEIVVCVNKRLRCMTREGKNHESDGGSPPATKED